MRMAIRIYYEDTDCGGVVYYANYLRYFERGRTELLRERGVSLTALHEKGVVFAVIKADVSYLSPCRYGELVMLDTRVGDVTGATMTFEHTVRKEGSDKDAVRGVVVMASLGQGGRPVRIPQEVRSALKAASSV